MTAVAVIDAGGANFGSVCYALQRLGVQPHIARDAESLAGAQRVILPGVGVAAQAMRLLHERGFAEVLPTLDVPVLGICLGMQLAVVEFSRNAANLTGANSSEFDENTCHPVIDLLPEQKGIEDKGGTMRLGVYPCRLIKDSKAYQAFQDDEIYERHRHRYEFNNEYKEQFEENGMIFTGFNPDSDLAEVVEIPALKWFVGTQFHPEYSSTVISPNPLFMSFMSAIINK